MIYKINELEYIQNFILGGRANFVINDMETGDHIEFKVKRKIDTEIYYVQYKSIDWVYIGYIHTVKVDDLNVPVFKKKDIKGAERAVYIFDLLIKFFYYIQRIPTNIEFLYTGICSRCGRKLTDPEYIRIGIGKVCLTKDKQYKA